MISCRGTNRRADKDWRTFETEWRRGTGPEEDLQAEDQVNAQSRNPGMGGYSSIIAFTASHDNFSKILD